MDTSHGYSPVDTSHRAIDTVLWIHPMDTVPWTQSCGYSPVDVEESISPDNAIQRLAGKHFLFPGLTLVMGGGGPGWGYRYQPI